MVFSDIFTFVNIHWVFELIIEKLIKIHLWKKVDLLMNVRDQSIEEPKGSILALM